MKTDIDIRDDVFTFLKTSPIMAEVTGKLYTGKRPIESNLEDVCISVLANSLSDKQEAYVNVNIYIKDISRKGINEENTKRIRLISRIALDCLRSVSNDYRLTISEQKTIELESIGYHVINNKVLYQFVEN